MPDIIDQWCRYIDELPTGTEEEVAIKRRSLFFHSIEIEVHPAQTQYSEFRAPAEALRVRLSARMKQRAVAIRCGRSLGSTPEEKQRLDAENNGVREPATKISNWLVTLINKHLVVGQKPPGEALADAFDAFALGKLRWRNSEYGVPDSSQVLLFAEMAILFRQLGLTPDIWRSSLHSFVRGAEVFAEIGWDGGPRRDSSYNAWGYARQFSDARFRKLRSSYPPVPANSDRDLESLEYRYGALALWMLRDQLQAYPGSASRPDGPPPSSSPNTSATSSGDLTSAGEPQNVVAPQAPPKGKWLKGSRA